MALPDFLIIGAQKAGTTWLHRRLQTHPAIFMPDEEVHFFDKAFNYEKGLDWYRRFFQEAGPGAVIGERTPDYYWTGQAGAEHHLPNVHENIYETLPDTRLILVLREPVDRAISAANHIIRSGRVAPWHDIDELLLGEKRHLIEDHGVIDYGRYHKHIQAFLEYFDRHQLLTLVFEEDIVESPRQGLEKVMRFLEIETEVDFPSLTTRENTPSVSKPGLYLRHYLPPLEPIIKKVDALIGRDFKLHPSKQTVRTLEAIYAEENEKLFDWLGRRIEVWETRR